MDRLPPMDSRKLSTNSNNTLERLTEAKKGAARLLGCYRSGDANDPETYVTAVVAVLEQYPVEIIRAVTAPATGLASKLKWLPAVAEIRDACEELGRTTKYAREWEAQARAQITGREALAIEHQRPRKTYEQIVAEFRDIGIMIGPKGKTAVDVQEIRKRMGISQADWDAIPNAKGAA
jgi:hypothetical protein